MLPTRACHCKLIHTAFFLGGGGLETQGNRTKTGPPQTSRKVGGYFGWTAFDSWPHYKAWDYASRILIIRRAKDLDSGAKYGLIRQLRTDNLISSKDIEPHAP